MDSDHRPTPYEDAALTAVLLRQKQMPQLNFANNGIGFSSYNMVGETKWWAGMGSNHYRRIFSPLYTPSIRPAQKMVGRDGLEPPTFRVSAEGSNQLSYLPMESTEGIGPPFADLQSAAKASIDNVPNGCGERNRTYSIGFRDRGTTVMQLRILKLARRQGFEP